jgi:adenylate cyclase
MNKLPAFFARMTKIPDRIPMKDRRRYSICIFASVFGCFLHVGFLIAFYFLGVTPMFYYGFISVLTWMTVIFITIRFQKYSLVAIIGIAEIVLHQVFAVFYVGWAPGFQYLLIMVAIEPFLVMPESRMRLAIATSAAPSIVFLLLAVFLSGASPIYAIPIAVIRIMNITNILILLVVQTISPLLFAYYVKKAEDKADAEFERAENLLHNILPVPIAERLKAAPLAIADGFDCATVLFCDIVDFTKLAERLTPAQVVDFLNALFSRFDVVADKYGLEKIKTIGDAYMVASGLPERRACNAHYMAEFALDVLDEIRAFNRERGMDISMRIGMNSGPVVAGVIGKRKFIYDLWGDAVNMASRMESHGIAGKIQVTDDCYRLLEGEYEFEDRGIIEVKSKGPVRAWILTGKKAGIESVT